MFTFDLDSIGLWLSITLPAIRGASLHGQFAR